MQKITSNNIFKSRIFPFVLAIFFVVPLIMLFSQQKNVDVIRKWFPKQGIHLAGRFSYFEYINTDGAVKTAREIAAIINKEK